MPTFDSTQYAKFAADPRQAVKINEWGGRVRAAFFSYTALGTEVATDTINLVRLPKGARVLDGHVVLDTTEATLTMDIGTAADPDKYGNDLDVNLLDAPARFAHTPTLNYGVETTEDEDVIALLNVVGLTAGTVVTGHMLYALD